MPVYVLVPQSVAEHVSVACGCAELLEAHEVGRSGIGCEHCLRPDILVDEGGAVEEYHGARYAFCDG